MNRLIIFLMLFKLPALSFAGTVEPIQLKLNDHSNPMGIEPGKPVFSWNLQSSERGQLQTAYELRVAKDVKDLFSGKDLVWNTGKILDSRFFGIEYQGQPLESMTRYYWTVRVYGKNGIASAWSHPAYFETGLLKPEDWKAKWIGDGKPNFSSDAEFYQTDPMPVLRRKININKKVKEARLYISGLGYYEAYINGEKIGDRVLEPGFTNYSKQIQYSVYDVTTQFRKGENVLGVMLGNGWYNPLPLKLFGRFNLREHLVTGRPKVLAQYQLLFTDGTVQTIMTDENWETARGPITRNNIYLGEEYDAQLEKDFRSKEGWSKALVVDGPIGSLVIGPQPPIRITGSIKPISKKK